MNASKLTNQAEMVEILWWQNLTQAPTLASPHAASLVQAERDQEVWIAQ